MTLPPIASPSAPQAASSDLTLFDVLSTLLRARRAILTAVLLGAALGAGIAFGRPRSWSSGFAFVPLQTSPSVGGLAGLAGQLGLNLSSLTGGSRPPEFFVAAVQTREVLLPVLRDTIVVANQPLAVLDFLKVRGDTREIRLERALKKFRNRLLTVSVADRQSSIVRVGVRTQSPEASHAIASSLLEALNAFTLTSRRGQASAERRYARERLDSAVAVLSSAEDQLTAFIDRNRDLSASAPLALQRDRLQREVTMQQQLVTALVEQYEEARLREYQDTPEVSIVDRPFRPPLPNSRLAAVLIAVGGLAGLVFGVLRTLVRDAWLARRGDTGFAALVDEWRGMRGRQSNPTL